MNLSNISKATTFFREIKRIEPTRVVSRQEKAAVLEKLEQKSAREGERILLALNPPAALPQERVRQVTLEHTELRFTIDAELKAKLARVRSLMGARGGLMSLAELVSEMATLSAERLEEKKFGKRRVQAERKAAARSASSRVEMTKDRNAVTSDAGTRRAEAIAASDVESNSPVTAVTPTSDAGTKGSSARITSDVRTHRSPHFRYIPQTVKHAVWRTAQGKCANCASTHKLQFIKPVALGGESIPENLRVLCSSCNIRRGVKTFGTEAMRRDRTPTS